MVPATSASSTIDSLLSLLVSSSVGIIEAIMAWFTRGASDGSYGETNCASAAQALAFSVKLRVLAALEDGRSINVTFGGSSPISLRPAAAAVEPLNAIARRSG